MSIIRLQEGNCQNCYKCIRGCPIKAIEFKDGRAAVIEEDCILCGRCVKNCPQNAKYVVSELDRVKRLLAGEKPVYVTVAPSWSGYWGTTDFGRLTAALKSLGFQGVEETAIGAYEVSKEYAALMEKGEMRNVIVTACSSLVSLVEKHYPKLISALAPVSSPMMAHARMMRESYGDIKVVFIGPCFSKKSEAADPLAGGLVDNVLTFDELDQWIAEEGLSLDGEDSSAPGVAHPIARLYPTPCGIVKTIAPEALTNYRTVTVDGFDRCLDLLDAMEHDNLTGLFVEANICAGSCLGGPVMRLKRKNPVVAQGFVSEQRQERDDRVPESCRQELFHPRAFANRAPRYDMPTEEQIAKILAKTGKFTKEQELNCGSCGYASCREKAIAVYQGKADINMCLPFFRERAENLSNTVLSNSPNAIFALDGDLLIQDMNPMAETMFGLTRKDALGLPLDLYLKDLDFEAARKEQRPAVTKAEYEDLGKIAEQTVVYVKEHNMYVAFVKDITQETRDEAEMEALRRHTVETAQQVIDKQMRVAQEIASLLGETTAETKVALTKLKKSMAENAGE